jgi:hypothetical protein
VDVSSLVDVLRDWQDTEQRAMVRGAQREADTSGLLEGEAAARDRRAPTVYAGETLAEEAFNRSSRAAYFAGLENDWHDTANRLQQEHPLDAQAFAAKAEAALGGTLSGLDRETAAEARLRGAQVFGRYHRSVVDAEAAQGRAVRGAALKAAISRRVDEVKRAARQGDVDHLVAVQALINADLVAGAEAGDLDPAWVESVRIATAKGASEEAWIGEWLEADDPDKAIREARQGQVPEGFDPKEWEAVLDRAEALRVEGKASEVRRLSQEATEAILLRGGSLAEQRARAKEIADPEVQDATLQRIEHEWSVKESQEADALSERMDAFWADFGVAPTAEKLLDLMEDPAVPRTEKVAARSYLEHEVDRKQKGGPADWQLVAELSGESATDPAAYVKRNLYKLKPQLGDQFDNALAWQRAAAAELRRREEREEITTANKAIAEQERKERAVRAQVDAVVRATARGLGLNPGAKPGSTEAARYGALYERVYRWADTAKPATREEVQNHVDQLLLKGELDKPWRPNPERYAFEVTPEEVEQFQVEGIPAAALPELMEALTERGQRITPANLRRLWEAAGGE